MPTKFRDLIFVIAMCIVLPLFAAEDEPKNVKVLKGLSHSELITAMTFIRTSLGVRCDYCHVMTEQKRDFASDEKKTKEIARKMMSMVIDLNHNNFDNRPEVSCFTCHQGHTKPTSVPPLPVPQTADVTASFTAADKLTSPPAPDQITAKYLEAVGGKAAVQLAQEAKTTVWKATREGSEGKPASLEVSMAAPDKILLVMNTAQGTSSEGFNGKTGWMKDSEGQQELEADDIERLKSSANMFQVAPFGVEASALTLRGKDAIGNHEVFVLQGKVNDNKSVSLYFDSETGLLLRKLTLQKTPIGVVPQELDYDDYRAVNGVKIPFTVHVIAIDPRGSATIKLTEFQTNVPVDAKRFAHPEKGSRQK